MHHPTRLKLDDMNPHFMCVLCDGYLVDATTIIECLHSFCRTCIVRYLENSRFCPVCDVQVHKTKPLQSIRSDKTLQDIVYKLVPGLYQNEMKRRKELYSEHPEAVSGCSPEDRGEGADHRFIYAPDETISLSLEYLNETNKDLPESSESKPADDEGKDPQKRYLQCPAAISVSHLKKFISMKFGLPQAYTVEIIHHDDILSDDYTLMDIAYIYAWKRAGPMQFFYNITRRVVKRVHAVEKPQLPSIAEEPSTSESAATCDPAPEESSEPKPKLQKLDSEKHASENSDGQLEDRSRKPDTKSDISAQAASPIQVQEPSSAGAPKPISADIANPEVSSSRSEHPVDATTGPVPQAAAPKVVCTTATVIPTTNGVTLKFVQCHQPAADIKNRSAKKPAGKRSAGRIPRSKVNTARAPLVRLAPYPPPSCGPPPVTCLTTAPMTHLTPIAVRNLVAPTVTGLPPLMTTLRPTVNTLCSSTMSSPLVATHSPFGGYSPHTAASYIQQTVNTSTPVMAPHFPGLTATGFVTAAETAVTNLRPATSAASLNVLPVQTLPSMQSKLPVPTSESSQPQVYIEAPIKPVMVQANSSTLATCGTPNPPMVSSSQSCEAPQVSNAVTISTTPSNSVSTTTPSVTVTEDTSVLSTTEKSEIGRVSPPVTAPGSVRLCPNTVPKTMTDDQRQLPITISNVCSVAISEPVTVSATLPDSEKKSPLNQLPELPESSPTSNATDKPIDNGVKSPQSKSPVKDGLAFPRTFTIEKKSDDFPLKITVKNTISAEFSDNDDLGCQPDLVVDERNSSDNEDDDALRKKITAIAEKDDEADVTDDTEADSGRASDISSQARSSCDDDVGSPMMSVDSVSSTVTSSSTTTFTSHLPPFTTPSSVSITATEEPSHRPSSKSIGLDHVINNIYRNHEQRKDTFGALDLSTCTRKPGEEAPRFRQKAVANPPVLDVKHRQQTCLSAPPSKPHTACVPSPKHPTSLHIAAHHGLMTASAAGLVKPMQLPIPYSTMAFPCQSRPNSSPGMIGKPFNSSMMVPNAHQNLPPMMVPHQCVNASFQGWSPAMAASIQGRNTPTPSPRRNVSSPVLNANKFAAVPKQPCPSPSAGGGQHRKANSDCVSKSPARNHNNLDFIAKYSPGDRNGANLNVDCMGKSPSHRNGANLDCGNANKSPSGRSRAMASPSPHRKSSPNPVATTPSKPVTSKAMTSHLVSCASSTLSASSTTSSASYKPSQHATTSPSASYKPSHHSTVSSSAPYKPSQPTMPINNKKSNSHKNHGYRLYRNLAVINPDPNGYRQKIVIKNLDFRPNNHQPQDFSRS